MITFQNSKSFLEFIGKDATLLGVSIVVLFTENAYHLTFDKSLTGETNIDLGQVFQFKFLFGMIIFMFVCKLLYLFFWNIIQIILPINKIDISVSYKIGFGSFVISLLLFSHSYLTDETNSFVTILPEGLYKFISITIGLFSLFVSTLCNWNEK